MENQQINDSMSNRRLLPPLYPGSPITANFPRAANSAHHNSPRHPFQHNPAAPAAHFASQAGPSSYQQPPSLRLLSSTTHASAGVGGISSTVSQDIVSGSGYAAGSSSYRPPPSPLPGGNTSGGHATFFSSPDTAGLASVAGLAPLKCTQPPFTWSVDQAPSGSGGLPAPLLAQTTATVAFKSTEGNVLPPLPPALRDLPLRTSHLEAVQYVDLEGPLGGHLNSSGRDWGSTSTQAPQPYSSGYTCITPTPLAVKKEAVEYWSWGTSQLGKNNFTSGGSSSAPWIPQPHSSGSGSSTDLMVLESKPNQLPSPLVEDFADGQFTQDDIDKIMADKVLGDIVLKDPKRVWRILRNRRASERSRQKKIAHLSDLERQVVHLQQENKWLTAQVYSLQGTTNCLTAENNKMMIKLYGVEQETQQKIALNETLNDEVRRLKLLVGEIRGSSMSNSLYQEMCPQKMQPEQLNIDSQPPALVVGETRGSLVSNSSYQERSPQTIQPVNLKIHNHQLAQLQQDQELQEFENFIMQ